MAICYTMTEITNIGFAIGGDFVTDLKQLDFDWILDENGTVIGLGPETPAGVSSVALMGDIAEFTAVSDGFSATFSDSDAERNLIGIILVVVVIVCLGCGVGIAYVVCCCLYRPKFKRIEEMKDDGLNGNMNRNNDGATAENEPMMNETDTYNET